MTAQIRVAELVREQIAYYEARATDWENYAGLGGPYPNRVDDNRSWFRDLKLMEQSLAAFKPTGDVLEIAAGTGLWSAKIAETAGAMTVLDSSPSMLERNRARCAKICGRQGIAYRAICADIFEWVPDAQFDVIFFAYWVCHVPKPLFGTFWHLIASCLKPKGRLLFFDTRSRSNRCSAESPAIVQRQLRNGREFQIIKIKYAPGELETRLRALGFDARVRACGERGLIGTVKSAKREYVRSQDFTQSCNSSAKLDSLRQPAAHQG